MNQVGLATGVAVGAGVLLVYALLRRAAGPRKRNRRGDAGGDSSSDSGSGWSGDRDCQAADAGGSCDGGGGGDGGGD